MKEGDVVDLVLTKDADGEPTVKVGDTDLEVSLQRQREGQPIPQDAILLRAMPCLGHPNRLHAEVMYAPESTQKREPPAEGKHSGPARVSNQRFRSGWDNVFGGKTLN